MRDRLAWVLAAASGLALLAAHPPVGLWPLAFAAPVLLLAAVDVRVRAGRSAVPVGLLAGACFHAPLLAWLIAPAGIVGWGLLALVQILWAGVLAALLAVVVRSRWVVALAPVAWVGVDAWRGLVPLSGFSWGAIEYTQVDNAWLLPIARLAGGRAIAVVAVLLAAWVFESGRRAVDATRDDAGRVVWSRLRSALPAGQGAAGGLAATMLAVTLVTVGPPPTDGTADVLVVQGNDIERFVGTGLELDEAIARQMLEETRDALSAGAAAPDLVVWPESSIDRDPARAEAGAIRSAVTEAAAITEGRLLAGANLDGPRPGTFLNVSLQLAADGSVVDRYQKRQLVPFGEYVPLREQLDWFAPLRQVPRDALPGERAHALDVEGLRVAVAICFETMFPGVVRGNVLAGDAPAQLLVASTNDASFGRSAQPAQHLAQTRMRAVETGRWAVHAAVSGTSAFVDPEGRAHDVTELFTRTTLRRELPLAAGRTPYLATGDWLGWLVRLVTVGLAGWSLRGRRRRRTGERSEDRGDEGG